MKKERIGFIDDVRGFALVAMIFYHAAFNLVQFSRRPLGWLSHIMESDVLEVVRVLFVIIFLLLAGICTRLTRRPFVRALKVGIGALLVTAATWLFVPADKIIFGILHLMAFSMLFYAVSAKVLCRIHPLLGSIVCALLGIFTFSVQEGFLGFGALRIALPASLYQSNIGIIFGFPPHTFQSFDYAPILPYLFFFLCGSFLVRLKLPTWKSHSRFFAFVGRHSLWVYLLHQPILWGIFLILERCGI